MTNFTTCTKCELTFVPSTFGQQLCPACLAEQAPKRKSNSRNIMPDAALGGVQLPANLDGYQVYLMKRNYCSDASYRRAIEDIMNSERRSFAYILRNISIYEARYGKGGLKQVEGQKGHATYVNALHRAREFCNYLLDLGISV